MPNTDTLFVSYSRVHETEVTRLVELLRLGSAEIFLDAQSIHAGEKWGERIEAAIRNSRLVVVFWCCHSSQSEWVHRELLIATSCNKSFAPIRLCSFPIPQQVSVFQWIDLSGDFNHSCNAHPSDPYPTAGDAVAPTSGADPASTEQAVAEVEAPARNWLRRALDVILMIAAAAVFWLLVAWVLRPVAEWLRLLIAWTALEVVVRMISVAAITLGTVFVLFMLGHGALVYRQLGRTLDRDVKGHPMFGRGAGIPEPVTEAQPSQAPDEQFHLLAREIERRYFESRGAAQGPQNR